MCAPTGQRIPFGSPEPSAFTYSKSFNCSANPSRRAILIRRQGERNAVAPSPAHLCREQFRIDLALVRLKKIFEADDVGFDLLNTAKLPFTPSFRGSGTL